MLNGKEKVQVLLKVLGPNSQNVLSNLEPEKAKLFMQNVENAPILESSDLINLLDEFINKVAQFKNQEDVVFKDQEQSITELKIKEEEKSNKLDHAVELLIKEKPQTIAFVLAKLSESERVAISSLLPINLKQEVAEINIENVPLSDKIFQIIYQRIFNNLN